MNELNLIAAKLIETVVQRLYDVSYVVERENIDWRASNQHRMVVIGKAPNVSDAFIEVAEDIMRRRIRRFVELPDKVKGAAAVAITDRTSGVSLRVLADPGGLVIDYMGWSDAVQRVLDKPNG